MFYSRNGGLSRHSTVMTVSPPPGYTESVGESPVDDPDQVPNCEPVSPQERIPPARRDSEKPRNHLGWENPARIEEEPSTNHSTFKQAGSSSAGPSIPPSLHVDSRDHKVAPPRMDASTSSSSSLHNYDHHHTLDPNRNGQYYSGSGPGYEQSIRSNSYYPEAGQMLEPAKIQTQHHRQQPDHRSSVSMSGGGSYPHHPPPQFLQGHQANHHGYSHSYPSGSEPRPEVAGPHGSPPLRHDPSGSSPSFHYSNQSTSTVNHGSGNSHESCGPSRSPRRDSQQPSSPTASQHYTNYHNHSLPMLPSRPGMTTYYFRHDAGSFNSMTMYTYDARPIYHIEVSINCFMPTSYLTNVRRVTSQGPLVASFEMGISRDKATLTFGGGGGSYWLSDVFKDFRVIKSKGPGRWTWCRPGAPRNQYLEWSTSDNAESRCQHHDADSKRKVSQFPLATLVPPGTAGQPPTRDTFLYVHPNAQTFIDDVVLSALIVERKRQSPTSGTQNGDLFNG